MKRKKASKGVLIDVALLLLCFLCVTTCLSSGIMAKYASRATDSRGARAAGFAVSAHAEQDPDDPTKYTVMVESESEVAADYSLELVFKSEIKDILKVSAGGRIYEASAEDPVRITIPKLGTLGAGKHSKSIVLTFIVDGVVAEPIDFVTYVRFEQAD